MKRKAFTFISVLLILLLPLYADAYGKLSKGFSIQGGYHDFFSLNVKPLSVESQDYAHGMPFDLMGNDVRGQEKVKGRTIALFNVISNAKNFTFRIAAQDMKFMGDAKGMEMPRISYQLIFNYDITYFYGGDDHAITGQSFSVTSTFDDAKLLAPDTVPISLVNPLYDDMVDEGTYLGINDGTISFKLTPDGDNAVHGTDLPEGYYKGKVVMWLITDETTVDL